MGLIVLSLFLGVMWSYPVLGASLYRWKDKEGVIHVTDVPPPSGSYETIGGKSEKQPPPDPETPIVPPAGEKETSQRKSPGSAAIPLRRSGNHFLVKMGVNGKAEGFFLLDTGASVTVISPEIAQKAGISLDDSLPIVPIKTVSNIIFKPVAHVEKFTLGGLALSGSDVLIHDIRFGNGVSGLLGMDLLSDYKVTLDAESATLVLTSARGAGPVYGGHPRRWWKGRFAFYRHNIRALEGLAKAPERTLAYYHVDRERVEASIAYYRDRLGWLKRLAEGELVPLEWRK